MLVWYALLNVYISTGPLRYEQAFNRIFNRRLADLSPASYWSHSSKILEDNSLSLYLERSDYSLERSDYMVERSDQRMERSVLERSGHGTK